MINRLWEFVIPGVDSNPLDKAYRSYRAKHYYLQPEEIKNFRKRYRLTQSELASLLGLSGA
jgi:DNA-binding transcriptional regulator YiaG